MLKNWPKKKGQSVSNFFILIQKTIKSISTHASHHQLCNLRGGPAWVEIDFIVVVFQLKKKRKFVGLFF